MDILQFAGIISSWRILELSFRLWGDREFILFKGQHYTRRQVWASVNSLAAGLQSLGVNPGDRIASLLPACPEAVYAFFLPWVLGTVQVPLNPLLGESELRHILENCAARVLIVPERWYGIDYPHLLARLQPELPALEHVLIADQNVTGESSYRRLSAVMTPSQHVKKHSLSGDELVAISYTSGTTGLPKGVAHTRSRVSGLSLRQSRFRMDLAALRCVLIPFPPHHFSGRLVIALTAVSGGKLILMERFDPQRILATIQQEKVSQLGGSPTMYRLLMNTPGQERYDLSSLKRVAFSTETMPLELAQALHERVGCHLENLYGTSESMLISWTGLEDDWETAARTLGKPVPNARVRIVDDERHPVPVGAQGEIAVQTRTMMSGYYGDPELTAQVLDEQGWFYTGDVGSLGEDGYLRLVGRKKDFIIRGGENIYPQEIEFFLEKHPQIRRAAVIGVPHALTGEAVWAYLELKPGATLTPREVLNHCRGKITPQKIPQQVRFVEQLPTNSLGKVQKFILRQYADQELQARSPITQEQSISSD